MRHHSNTSNINRNEVFVPKKRKEIVAIVGGGWGVTKYLQHPLGWILMIAFMLLLGWPLYLICNVSGTKYPWKIYVGFVANIDIRILGGGVTPTLLSIGAVFLLEVFSQASSHIHDA
jgi:hypothetical protein